VIVGIESCNNGGQWLVRRHNGSADWLPSTEVDLVWQYVCLLHYTQGSTAAIGTHDLLQATIPPTKKLEEAVYSLKHQQWPSLFPERQTGRGRGCGRARGRGCGQ